ncbi:TonB-linked outer membrane protein, SusC/RagA family [Parapedobacter composti]|uniref:TonB-linked outer membrane protein, SusC/RagA family n=1 Tax=Parapedobacter composti TaxID=623281 RepID=A0A1I1LXM7_9SPHI|nr:TonB-dependent receptor [Parapedobacter composti]SFC77854.1 TonB-linked outer membrane protein, SusC/RagA family [Parapedobacter composti]
MKPINQPFNRLLLSVLIVLATFGLSHSAQQPVTGRVLDEQGIPLAGATVEVKGGTQKSSTDDSGTFRIAADPGTVLVVSYVGYLQREFTVTDQRNIEVGLQPLATDLDEVVVVGYTSQRRTDISGAVASVDIDAAAKRRVPDIGQMLQGQVAGVQVSQSTGAPGDPIDIRIRGVGTIGSNDPLYIVDGVPTTDFTFINPQDIESMNVLKDASAAAMYGARAAAGVVVITTKQGKSGKTSIDVNYFNGVQRVAGLPTMLNTEQYLAKLEEAWNNSGYSGTNPYTAERSRTDLANTNWLDELFETGHSQNVQLTASGGNEKTRFLLSGGYYRQNGIVVFDNDKYERLNFRTNINSDLSDRLRVGTNLQLSYEQRNPLSSRGDAPGIIRHALLRPPVLGVYKDAADPTYSADDPFTDLPFYQGVGSDQRSLYELTSNPVALAYFTDHTRRQFKTFGNVFAEFDVLRDKSLKFKSNFGVDLNFNHNKVFNRNFGDDDGGGNEADKGLGRQNRPNSLNEDRGDDFTFTWNNTLSYEKIFGGKHNLNALAGTEFIRFTGSSINASRARFEFDDPSFRYIDLGGTELDLWNGGIGSEWALFSLFGTASYVYDGRYLLTANLRADASSRFGPNNQWGYFPSVSAGWVISREAFMQNVSWLDHLKLRLSTGSLGNQASLGNYDYLTLYRREGENFVVSRYGNPDLRWESTTQHNAGLDIGLMNNRLTITADYFIKNTKDILLPVSLPRIGGDVDPTVVNAGEVRNAGVELGVGYRSTTSGGFSYSVNANLATLTNEVGKLHPNLPYISSTVSRTQVGTALDAYYGFVREGIYQNAGEIAQHLHGTPSPSAQPGDIRFRDLNGDGVINDLDRTFIGSPIPDLTYGVNLSGAWKGFDLALLVQGVSGIDRYNDAKKILDYDTRPFNYTTAVLGSWNGEGSTNSIPRVSFTDNGSSRISSIYVEDASYLRLKNVELGYSFGSLLQHTGWGVQNVRVYASAQNLFTLTDYTGLDPESTDLMDMGTYPLSRAFLFGINVTF